VPMWALPVKKILRRLSGRYAALTLGAVDVDDVNFMTQLLGGEMRKKGPSNRRAGPCGWC
jgi:hypothetical protein